MPRDRKTWRCFHCDEVFRSKKQARLHFGGDEYEGKQLPACIDPLRTEEKARMDEVRKCQEYALQCQREGQQAEERTDELEYELKDFRHITGCSNTHELRMWMDSQQGRVVTANALIEGFRKAAPELLAQIVG